MAALEVVMEKDDTGLLHQYETSQILASQERNFVKSNIRRATTMLILVQIHVPYFSQHRPSTHLKILDTPVVSPIKQFACGCARTHDTWNIM